MAENLFQSSKFQSFLLSLVRDHKGAQRTEKYQISCLEWLESSTYNHLEILHAGSTEWQLAKYKKISAKTACFWVVQEKIWAPESTNWVISLYLCSIALTHTVCICHSASSQQCDYSLNWSLSAEPTVLRWSTLFRPCSVSSSGFTLTWDSLSLMNMCVEISKVEPNWHTNEMIRIH